MQTLFAFILAVLVTALLMSQWKRVLAFFVAVLLVLASFGLFMLLSLM